MQKMLLPFLLGLLLSGCSSSASTVAPTLVPTRTATQSPTQTSIPTPTATPPPTPDLSLVGLPTEEPGMRALDFAATLCSAQWFTEGQKLPCPGDDTQSSAGYVTSLSGDVQGLPPELTMILTYPPQVNFGTIFSKYPPFVVEKGDRFRAVLACKLHTFCDVEFALEYYDKQGKKTGFARWPYRFTDPPLVVNYPLDGIAGKTVQFGLSVRGNGNRTEAYAVWIVPHIYRPVH